MIFRVRLNFNYQRIMYKNLDHYIAALQSAGELIRVTEFVDPVLEISEITDRQSKLPGGGRALLFENTGTGFPVLTNMMGSVRRMCMTLGVQQMDDVGNKIDALFGEALSPRRTLMDKLRLLPLLGQASAWMPKYKSGRGVCQQVELSGLDELPILKCWPLDGGRFITLPMVHTVDPVSGSRNVGMYRMQVFDNRTTGMHWHRHKTGERHYCAYAELGRRMPVAVCLGGDPVYAYAATAPLPDGIDEYMLAGFLRGKPVEMVKCLTCDLEVPSDCDFVIEGYVDPTEDKVLEGDFGDHTGYYSLQDYYPKFHVTAITARRGAVYPATLVGIPPQEDEYIAMATEKIFLSPIRFAIAPEIRELTMPRAGVAHNIAICSIEKRYAGQGFKVANALWGAGQMMFNKLMIIKDHGVTLQQAWQNFNPMHDMLVERGTLDVLDHTSAQIGFGGKICLDLTTKLPAELPLGSVPVTAAAEFVMPRLVEMNSVSHLRAFGDWRVVVVCSGAQYNKAEVANELLGVNDFVGLRAVVIFDEHVELDQLDVEVLVWMAAANADAARDTVVVNNTLVVDARVKRNIERGFPNVVVMDRATIEAVDARWERLGLGNFIASPSLKYRALVLSDKSTI